MHPLYSSGDDDSFQLSSAIFKASGGRDTVGFAFFLSSYLSAYKALLCTMRRYRSHHEGDRLNAFVAGSIAGLAMWIDKNKIRRKALALYLLTRSIQFGSSYSMKKWAEHREAKKSNQGLALQDRILQSSGKEYALDTKTGWDNILAKVMSSSAGAVLMSSSAAVNLYACMVEPDAMPQSYWRFIMHHTGLPQKFGPMLKPLLDVFASQLFVLRALPPGVENIMIPAGVTSREFVSTLSPSVATVFPSHVHHEYQLCALMHPLTPCAGHFKDVLTGEFDRAIRMYAPLNFLLTLVFQHKKLAVQPREVVQRYIKSTIRSSLFMTMYTWGAFYTLCVMRRIFKRERTYMYFLNGIIAGFAVLIEAPGRQVELGLYCLPRALDTAWHLMLKRGLVRNVPNAEMALFCASMGVIMTIYQYDPSVINTNYLSILTRIFGCN
ncbi:hypothetical protein BG015_003254 [Linnemannia schmuckeri]|uniref:Transmembrane protein 135 N-terminal domain-containing protein n=1 Tax=Linnemannia schmuckeri TaxID=64567 RepID=A0A9P5S660_9FUNG|nr:hypothetical protein BG015_003254 [Linnemannia schmuckeri]